MTALGSRGHGCAQKGRAQLVRMHAACRPHVDRGDALHAGELLLVVGDTMRSVHDLPPNLLRLLWIIHKAGILPAHSQLLPDGEPLAI